MKLLTKAPRGTIDILPDEIHKWHLVERAALEVAQLFGYREIRTPIFEHTELFLRSVGDTSDVVQKEMYTFKDKGDRSITLRPEGTAGVVRASIENGLTSGALPLKACYIANCFRYENPQAGRLREFRQFGVEVLGSEGPESDVEVISLCYQLFHNLGIDNITLEINSIGCPECRGQYHDELKHFFEDRKSELCPTCIGRMDKNPLRILDCKNKKCKAIAKDAPVMLDHLCDECSAHFDSVKSHLAAADIPYIIDPKIVRGLDYYTRTVFEFTTDQIGAQGTVCGGGRYNGLVGELGGQDIPGLGFAIGLNRLIMLMEASGSEFCNPRKCELYIAPMGDAAKLKSTSITRQLRDEGFHVETDLMNRSLRAQMKYADKLGALFTIVIGDNELKNQEFEIKNMQSGEKTSCTFDMLMSTMYAMTTDLNIDEVIEAAEFL